MRLIKNTFANLGGSLLGPLLALVLTPFFVRNLGLEGFGLIGFFSSLTILLGIVTVAIAKVYLRDMAARTGTPERSATAPAMFKTFFLLFAGVGLVAGSLIVLVSAEISRRVALQHIDPSTVQSCIILIALFITCSLPTAVCIDTLSALQEQVRANVIVVSVTLLTTVAAAGLVYSYQSVLVYYAATTTGALVTLLLLFWRASKSLRCRLADDHPWPSFHQALRGSWRESKDLARASLGLIWVEAAGVAITQTDRLLIVSSLPMSTLGTYNIGSSLARLVQMPCTSFIHAAFPKLCQAAATGKSPKDAAEMAFQQQGVVMTLACAFALPVCAVPGSILQLWIGNADVVDQARGVTAIFALAYGFLALAGPPYHLAVAVGKTWPLALFNLIAVGWYPLLGYWLVVNYGLRGAAILWLIYCFQAFTVCTLIAIVSISRDYCSWAGVGRILLIPLAAWTLGCMIRLIPGIPSLADASRVVYGGFGSLIVFSFGIVLILGPAQMARMWKTLVLERKFI